MIKPASLLAAALLLPSLALADTAYQALRTVGAKRGQAALNQVISVQGLAGTPNPETWKVLLDDPQARAGVRELQVSHGEVVSERTPTRVAGGGGAMDFHKLNLDSDSAFTVANKEATKAQIGFDSADFQLDGSSNGGAPVWVITLRDAGKNTAATIRVSANDGSVLSRNWSGGGGGSAAVRNDRDYVSSSGDGAPIDEPPPRTAGRDEGVPVREGRHIGDKLSRFGDKVKNHFMRDGAKLEKFFTGNDSLERKLPERGEDPPQ